jgi:hypothetical protein
MARWKRFAAAAVLGTLIFDALPLGADEPTPTVTPAAEAEAPTSQPPVKTGKERLSSKARDEQRVDNCKVPQELRGTTVRPDTCERKHQAIPTN